MNCYEHTLITRQDMTENQNKKLVNKYEKIINENSGKVLKTENWGLLNMSYAIKKNNKGNYIHFKIKGGSKIVSELEKNEKIDNNLLRYMTIKVNKFDLNTNYFSKEEKEVNKK